MDLVARKLMDGGEAAAGLLDEIEAFGEAVCSQLPELVESLLQAIETLRQATEWLVSQPDLNERFAGAVPYLKAFARVLGGYYHLKAASTESDSGPRTQLARFYILRLLPEYIGLLAHARAGAAGLYVLSADQFAA